MLVTLKTSYIVTLFQKRKINQAIFLLRIKYSWCNTQFTEILNIHDVFTVYFVSSGKYFFLIVPSSEQAQKLTR